MNPNANQTPKSNAPNVRHQAFAEAIAQGKTGSDAARAAGYKGTADSLYTQASRLLKSPEVQAVIAQAREASTSSRVATAQELKEFWTSVMKGEVTTTVERNGEAVTVGPTIADRIKAAELLGKTQALFVDRSQQDGRLEITVRRGADAAAALPQNKE